jgi:DNA-binding SARP family transcriptional activator
MESATRSAGMTRVITRLRVALGGLAVVLVLGVATPAVLVAVTVAIWPHGSGWHGVDPARLGVLVVAALAWIAWFNYIIGLAREVVVQIRQRNHPAASDAGRAPSSARVWVAGWVAGLVLIVLALFGGPSISAWRTSTPLITATSTRAAHKSDTAVSNGAGSKIPIGMRSQGVNGRAKHDWSPVRLPTGSVIGGTFAAGIISAVVAGQLRRRRHYRPQAPRPGRHLDPEPASPAVSALLLERASLQHGDDALAPSVISESSPMTSVPSDQVILLSDLIEVGSRGGELVTLALCDWPGLVLGGVGATSALRAWLAAIFARNGPFGAEVLLVDPLGDRLFPGLGLPGLRRLATAEEVIGRMEAVTATRIETLDEARVPHVTAHRMKFPEYPAPLMLCVVEFVPIHLEMRWDALESSARRVGLCPLVLTSEHDVDGVRAIKPHVVVEEDGSLSVVMPSPLAALLEGCMPFQINIEDAVDLLGPISLIHNDYEFDEPDSEDDQGAHEATPTIPGDPRPRVEATETGEIDWPTLREMRPNSARIRVGLLGPAQVEAWGAEIVSGLRSSAYELVAWFALHPEGATAEAAIDALWPDVVAKRGRERFWTALGNLRSRLAGSGQEGTRILVKVGGHYLLDQTILDIDLWRFEAALTDATQATGEAHVVALGRASAAYGGDFCPNTDAVWVEPVRQDLRRRALDVQIRLAELHTEGGNFESAIAALERAIKLDSICEEAYRRLMTVQSRLGRDDAAQRTWQLLQWRLIELDLEPETITVELVREVLISRSTAAGNGAVARDS